MITDFTRFYKCFEKNSRQKPLLFRGGGEKNCNQSVPVTVRTAFDGSDRDGSRRRILNEGCAGKCDLPCGCGENSRRGVIGVSVGGGERRAVKGDRDVG